MSTSTLNRLKEELASLPIKKEVCIYDKLLKELQKTDPISTVKKVWKLFLIDRGLRCALLFGNADYSHAGLLKNPIHDIKLISNKLEYLGFKVTTALNSTTKQDMVRELKSYAEKIQNLGDSLECSLFYYAGHGIQLKGKNYFIPIHTDIQSKADIKENCMSMNYALEKLSEMSDRRCIHISIIDACRNELNTRGMKSMTRGNDIREGLCHITAPSGSFVMFSAGEGKKALDTCTESDTNSPFAWALNQFLQDDVEITKLAKRVTKEVRRLTREKQTPYNSGDLDDDFFF